MFRYINNKLYLIYLLKVNLYILFFYVYNNFYRL